MIRRGLARHSYGLAVAGLLVAVCLAAGFIAVRVVPEMRQAGYLAVAATPTPSLQPSAVPSPSPSPSGDIVMNGAVIPATAQCSGCHLTDSGSLGLRPIPAMGHPLEGWTNCTACHATASLVATAPGHTGIHATQCLICHPPGNLPPPLSRPHRDRQNEACLACHGKVAPLPADMTHRSQNVCWLCHRLPDVPPPVPAHQTAKGETDCLTCHVAGKVGALPPDHGGRTGKECLLCHEVTLGSPSPAASPLAGPPSSATVPGATGPGATVPLPWPSPTP